MATKKAGSSVERAAIYVRRSTEQGLAESSSLEVQRDSCEAFVRLQGWAYDPATDYFEEVVSATRRGVERVKFNEVVKAADAGAFAHVVSYQVDRSARKWIDFGAIFDKPWRWWAAAQAINSIDHMEMFQLASIYAGRETRLLASRVGDSKKLLISKGNWVGSIPPFGFQPIKTEDGRRILVPKPGDAEKLVEAIDRVIAGSSVAGTARWLTEQGCIPTSAPRKGPDGKKRKNEYWSAQALTRLLRSPVLIGCRGYKTTSSSGGLVHGTEPIRDPETHELDVVFEPLITLEKWQALQARMARQRTSRLREGQTSLLASIARCSVCGYPLAASGGNATAPHTRVYRCKSKFERGPRVCPGNSVSRGHLERCAATLALLLLIGPAPSTDGPDPRAEQIARLELQIEEIVNRLYPAGGNPPAATQARALEHALKAREAELELLQKVAPIRRGPAKVSNELLDEFRRELLAADVGRDGLAHFERVGLWPGLPLAERREIVASVLDRILVAKGDRAATARLPNDQRGRIEGRLRVATASDPSRVVSYTEALEEATIAAVLQVRGGTF